MGAVLKKSINLLLTIVLFGLIMALFGGTVVKGEETYVTKHSPVINYVKGDNVITYSHPQYKLAVRDTLYDPSEAWVEVRVNDVLVETINNYQFGTLITKNVSDGDNYIEFRLFVAFPEGKPFVKQQVGYRSTKVSYVAPFNWNWQYADPSCEGLYVKYPVDLPHSPIDVNIKVLNNATGEYATFNFHNADGWMPEATFKVEDHPAWEGWKDYSIVWTQVHGTNYHWEGNITCKIDIPVDPEEPTNPEPAEPKEPIEDKDISKVVDSKDSIVKEVPDKSDIVKKDASEWKDLPQSGFDTLALVGKILLAVFGISMAVLGGRYMYDEYKGRN